MVKYTVYEPGKEKDFEYIKCDICKTGMQQYQYYMVSSSEAIMWFVCSEKCVTFLILSDLGSVTPKI
jgi:hypothetical protein